MRVPFLITRLLITLAPVLLHGGWKAGVAKVDITPTESIWLAGYGVRDRPSEGVLSNLYVKALSLEDERGRTSVIVTADLLGFTRAMSESIADRVRKQHGLTRDRLIFNASHTHSGPVTGQLLRPAYQLEPPHDAVVKKYTAKLLDKVVDVIGASLKNMTPAEMAFDQGLAGIAVNRRRAQQRHLPAPVDHDVPVLSVRGTDGKLRAVVFGYSCHATVLADYWISADWPGYAQETLEKLYPGATALYMNGCGADANPLPRRSVDLAKKYGEIMAAAVQQVLGQKMTPVEGPLRTTYETVHVMFAPPPSRDELETRAKSAEGSRRRHALYLLDVIKKEGKLPDRYPYPVEVWRFGSGLKLIALGGEVVADYALRFKSQYGWKDTWVAGYSNDVFAYIPSLRVLREGGYEGGGAAIPYGLPGPFAENIEEIIVRKVDDLMRTTVHQDARPGKSPK